MTRGLLPFVLVLLSFGSAQEIPVPQVDHHYHLFNPTLTEVTPVLPVDAASAASTR
jgi:hypothetical protein